MDIKEQIHGLTEEMLTNLGRLVAIDSQLGTPAEGKPFGEGPAKALEEGLKIAQELGFKTVNLDNYCGYAEMGEGDEIVGIAGHLDIVPVGGDWSYDPFKLTREGDYVYGRGTTDDKGPVLEALYAMKLLRDSGVKLNKRVRLIMGCNEETGSKCMEHYNEVAEELSCGFTPDASFPCIHGEKGLLQMMAYSKNTKGLFRFAITKKDREMFCEALKRFDMGLEDRMATKIGLLSGGQRQVVTLLMSTIVTPKLLLLDEHTAALDPATAEKVMAITNDIVHERNLTTLMITHNMGQALTTGSRTIMLDSGAIIFDIKEEERKHMTVSDLLDMYSEKKKEEFDNDRILLN